jgi:predicted transposase/invertase (TIGR01784 family)
MSQITPRVDIAFKKIFGVEENKDLLISLINSIVSPADQVEDITLLNPYNPQNFSTDKLSILDIKARGTTGKLFNIEIQVTDEADYDKRALYYWAKLYTEQLKGGEDYGNLSKAIGIHILNFISILKTEKYHNVFHITEKKEHFNHFEDLELHTIELKKFAGSASPALNDLLEKINSSLDVWVAFLTRHELLNKDNLPPKINQKPLQKALSVLDVMNFNPKERAAYEETLKWFQVEANTLKKAETRGIEIGKARGIEIGEARGIEIGEARGIEKMVIELFKQKSSLELICAVSGFSKEEVQNILNKHFPQTEVEEV